MSLYRFVSLLFSWIFDNIEILLKIMTVIGVISSVTIIREIKENIRELNRDFDKEKYQRKYYRNKHYKK